MDLSAQEFSATYKGLIPAKNLTAGVHKLHTSAAKAKATAQSIDWNAKGALTPIKNQGQCGSCWAFSATQQLESQFFQKYGTLKELSPQQLTSCDTADNGCNGGNPINAWGYISGFGGQEDASDYPYTSGTTRQSGTCKSNKADIVEDVGSSYSMISSQASEESNMLAQIQESPMSVCVDATLWQTYTGGVITTSSGCGTSIDHAVQATGYNAAGNYWIVRNSWPKQFLASLFGFRLARMGLAPFPSLPQLAFRFQVPNLPHLTPPHHLAPDPIPPHLFSMLAINIDSPSQISSAKCGSTMPRSSLHAQAFCSCIFGLRSLSSPGPILDNFVCT